MKFFKKFAAVFAAVVATVFLAAFATACDKSGNEDEFATTTFTVIVQDENGNPIDGTDAKWKNDAMPEISANVQVQFCAVSADGTGNTEACAQPDSVNSEGKATVSLEKLVTAAQGQNSNKVELHILSVTSNGYVKGESGEYLQYELDKIPLTITIKLKLAD